VTLRATSPCAPSLPCTRLHPLGWWSQA